MYSDHFALVLPAEPAGLDKRYATVNATDIYQFLIVVYLDGALPIQDIEIGRYPADAFFASAVDNVKHRFAILVERGAATGTPAVQIRIPPDT